MYPNILTGHFLHFEIINYKSCLCTLNFFCTQQFCISYCFLGIESHWVRSHKHNERLCFKMCVCLYNIFIFKSHNVKRLYQFIIILPVYEYHDCWQFLFFLFNDLIDQKKISDSKIEIFVSYLVIFKFPLPSHRKC